MNEDQVAARVVAEIVADLQGLSAGDAFWDSIDEDTHDEILSRWREIVLENICQLSREM